MTARTILGSLAMAALALTVPASATPSETDVGWIGELPGLSVFTQKTTAGVAKTVYTVSGSPDDTFAGVRKGLTDRGWTIETSKASSALGVVGSQKLVAEKAGSRVKIQLSQLGELYQLSVEQTGGGGPSRPSGSSEPRASTQPAPAPARPGASSPASGRRAASYDCGEGGDVTINNSSAAVTVVGRCEDLTVNGSRNVVTLEGDCGDLTVNGDSNEVRAEAAIDDITTNGDSNIVSWSAARNARGPRTQDNGTNNTIRRH